MKNGRVCCLACNIFIVFTALVTLAIGLYLFFYKDNVIASFLSKDISLQPGAKLFEIWKNPTVPIYLSLYMFNITNPEEIKAGKTPKVQQIGPYVYSQEPKKGDIRFSADYELLHYSNYGFYYFQPDRSRGRENDTFTGLNFPLLSLAVSTEGRLAATVQTALGLSLYWLYGQSVFRHYSVHEFLWGYQDPFFQDAKRLSNILPMGGSGPVIPDIFGMLTGPKANGSKSADWSIRTGKSDHKMFNSVHSYNQQRSLSCWDDPYNNILNGTSETPIWPFMMSGHDSVYMFFPPASRSLKFDYRGQLDKYGITSNHYTLSPHVFGTSPRCSECLPYGLLNISSCASAPILLSKPHFLHGDPKLQQSIDGLQPTEEYESMIDIHPGSGVGIFVEPKFQYNMMLKNYAILSETTKMNETVFPLMWMKVTADLGATTISQLCQQVDFVIRVGGYSAYVFLFLSIIMWTIIVCHQLCKGKKNDAKNGTELQPRLLDESETVKA